jgi:hypothetical protein
MGVFSNFLQTIKPVLTVGAQNVYYNFIPTSTVRDNNDIYGIMSIAGMTITGRIKTQDVISFPTLVKVGFDVYSKPEYTTYSNVLDFIEEKFLMVLLGFNLNTVNTKISPTVFDKNTGRHLTKVEATVSCSFQNSREEITEED